MLSKLANLIFSNLTCVITLGSHVRNKDVKRGGYAPKLLPLSSCVCKLGCWFVFCISALGALHKSYVVRGIAAIIYFQRALLPSHIILGSSCIVSLFVVLVALELLCHCGVRMSEKPTSGGMAESGG